MSAATEGVEEIVKEFLAESAEGLGRVELNLVELERDPNSRERLAEIFRTLHTLKGSSGMLGFSKLQTVAHTGESLLGNLRDGRLVLNEQLTSGLLAMVDAMRGLLVTIERTGNEGEADCRTVMRRLEELHGASAGLVPGTGADAPHAAGSVGTCSAESTVRVDVGLLDRMMDLAGELVLARNQALRYLSPPADSAVPSVAQRLKRTTAEMQEAVMKARLQPIGTVWNRFPRLARDLALSCGKQVIVEMEGSEIELDRGIIEAIKGPLAHILRNAVDHGIETPEQRMHARKTAAGHVRLRAYHFEGWVHVEVSDDGGGISLEHIRRRALEAGLIMPGQAPVVSDQELARLVFSPGFSTAERVTNISGRGVGLDVVRANIEKIGGVVDLHSVSGQGTTFHLKIPLTLALVPVLIVHSAGQRFAISQANVLKVERLDTGRAEPSIEQACGAPLLRQNDRLLPLCFLDRALHLPNQVRESSYIAVLQAGERQFGLVVDEVSDTEEVVVKPLRRPLRAIPCFGGSAILADGQVVLILDVAGLAQLAGVVPEAVQQPRGQADTNAIESGPAVPSWLVFCGTAESRFALPLSALERLEEIPAAHIERSGGQEVVQHRGEIISLVRICRLFHEPERERDLLQVVVIRQPGVTAGLVVDRIEDIVQQAVEVRRDRACDLLEGSAVIGQRVADILSRKKILAYAQETAHAAAADRSL